MKARLVLHGGPIYTGSPDAPFVGALAIGLDGTILATGESALPCLPSAGRVVDLRGRLATPGFNDAHIHLQWGGLARTRLDLRGVASLSEFLARVRRAAAGEVPGLCPSGWVLGRGWDDRRMAEGRPPALDELEQAAPGKPVFLKRVDGHSAVANLAALRRAGIGPTTPDPEGGRIVRAATGEPTGLLLEAAMQVVEAFVPGPTKEEMAAGLRLAVREALASGISSVQDHLGERALYEALRGRGEPCVRASLWHPLETPLHDLVEARQAFDPGDRWVRFGLLKGFLDGSLGSRTAALHDPYEDDAGSRGLFCVDPEDLEARVIAADAKGFQVGLHAIGDAACTLAADAFEAARRANPASRLRHRVEHAQILRAVDVARFARLGLVASMQPIHLASDLPMVRPRIGEARARGAYAWRRMLSHGVPLAFGSDWPVEPMDVLEGLKAAVTRGALYPAAEPLDPGEALTLREAIDAYTQGAAYAEGTDAWKGRLEPGSVGDVTIFDRNLFDVPPEHLTKARVELTVVGGEVVFE